MMDALNKLFDTIEAAGGQPFIVGGFVRDTLLGFDPKDCDVEVFGCTPERLRSALAARFELDEVGAAFGILKVRVPGLDEPVDVSLPRRENKTGLGHKGFEILSDPFLSMVEAARRRDFTINALAMDRFGEIHPESAVFGGVNDLQDRILRATDAEKFVEDPLRVLRAAQFLARFRFDADSSLVHLCSQLDLSELPVERIAEEFGKLFIKGSQPSRGLRFLRACGQLKMFPELQALVAVPQDPEWHPEGDVFEHTCHVVDAAVHACIREGVQGEDRWIVVLAALCHDLGKPMVTTFERGRWRALGHAEAGEYPTRSFCKRIGTPLRIVERVVPLVREHLAHINGDPNPRLIRRLAVRLQPATIQELALVAEADHSGRVPLPPGRPMDAWVEMARRMDLEVEAPKPILLGRHLIDAGLKPGKHFGELLARAFEAQLDGVISTPEDGLRFLGLTE